MMCVSVKRQKVTGNEPVFIEAAYSIVAPRSHFVTNNTQNNAA